MKNALEKLSVVLGELRFQRVTNARLPPLVWRWRVVLQLLHDRRFRKARLACHGPNAAAFA